MWFAFANTALAAGLKAHQRGETKLFSKVFDKIANKPSIQNFLQRKNMALAINGVFLGAVGALGLVQTAFGNFSGLGVLASISGLGYGTANLLKANELDGIRKFSEKTTRTGKLLFGFGRADSISAIFGNIPAAIIAGGPIAAYAIPPLVGVALLSSVGSTFSDRFKEGTILGIPKASIPRFSMASLNFLSAAAGSVNGQIFPALAQCLYGTGNTKLGVDTYRLEQEKMSAAQNTTIKIAQESSEKPTNCKPHQPTVRPSPLQTSPASSQDFFSTAPTRDAPKTKIQNPLHGTQPNKAPKPHI